MIIEVPYTCIHMTHNTLPGNRIVKGVDLKGVIIEVPYIVRIF
jgi:hypothetical protein